MMACRLALFEGGPPPRTEKLPRFYWSHLGLRTIKPGTPPIPTNFPPHPSPRVQVIGTSLLAGKKHNQVCLEAIGLLEVFLT